VDHQARRPARPAVIRTLAALAVALALACAVYLLLEAVRPDGGLISVSFLFALPAALCAFVSYVADPWKERSHRSYLMVPVWLLGISIVAGLVFLREGVVCVLMLAPPWLASGAAGAELTYRMRRRSGDGRTYSLAVLALPLVAMQVEPTIPLPTSVVTVSRAIEVDAAPAAIWPLLRGIPDVQPGEGRWNLTQDVIGVPRPLGARLVGHGIGADRRAHWEDGIRFRERIVDWVPGRRIGWTFIFDDIAGWAYTDRHLMPDSPQFTITSGGYRIDPLGPARSRVTIDTSYRLTTPVNAYARAWGELLLGDVENNLLAIIKGRAERAPGPAN